MKKIVPFTKEILFNTNIAQISSISLEHKLKILNNLVSLEFLVSGSYKVTDSSEVTDEFEYKLPFDISIDKKYDMSSAAVDINDFYYEVKNNKILMVNIEIVIDGLEEVREDTLDVESLDVPDEKDEIEEVKSVFSSLDDGERFVTYKVHVLGENDTLDSIMQNYGVTREELQEYNDLDNLNVLDKVIIPAHED